MNNKIKISLIIFFFIFLFFYKDFIFGKKEYCSNSYCIGQKYITSFNKKNYSLVTFKKEKDLFSYIFNLKNVAFQIKFQKIVYLHDKCILFFKNNKIIAIAGFDKNHKILKDLSVKDGIDDIVFRIGNIDLQIIKKEINTMYLYKSLGYAFFDDNNDDEVDMYLLFSPFTL